MDGMWRRMGLRARSEDNEMVELLEIPRGSPEEDMESREVPDDRTTLMIEDEAEGEHECLVSVGERGRGIPQDEATAGDDVDPADSDDTSDDTVQLIAQR